MALCVCVYVCVYVSDCPMYFASSDQLGVHQEPMLLAVKGRHFGVKMATFMRWMGWRVDKDIAFSLSNVISITRHELKSLS